MRTAVLLIAVGGALAWTASSEAASLTWTSIEVQASLDGDGRLQVAETHHMRLDEGGGFSLFREFGIGADQSIAFARLTRIEADGTEHPLLDGEVEDAGHYRFYERGHAHFLLPERPPGTLLSYRFEYELVHAVAPAWGVAAGPGSLEYGARLTSPLQRFREVAADWREAWPEPRRRYRLDHDVLLPSRDGPAFVVERVDYRLEYAAAWRRLHPEAELAEVEPDVHYRVRQLFEFLPPGSPRGAAEREAALRLAALAVAPVTGGLGWLAVVGAALLAARGWRSLDRATVTRRLSQETPELIRPWFELSTGAPTAEEVLNRLAGEGVLRVEVEPLRLTLLTPRTSLTEFEREVLEPIFPAGDATSAETILAAWDEPGFDPDAHVDEVFRRMAGSGRASRSRIGPLTGLLLAGGVVLQLRRAGDVDLLPLLLLADILMLTVVAGIWPRGWWHLGRPRRSTLVGLLLPLAVAGTVVAALLLTTSRPLPAEVWLGSALVAAACYGMVLRGALIRLRDETGERLLELIRIRRFAAAQLRRPRPALDDAWGPDLVALGLGPAIERWRARHARAPVGAQYLAGSDSRDAGPPFTGRKPGPAGGVDGWARELHLAPAEERRAWEEEEESEEDEAEEPAIR